jgi:LuxR family maltose regulon positive regulatory protein
MDRAATCEPAMHDPLPTVMLALARARVRRAGGSIDRAMRDLDAAGEGLPSWLEEQLGVERARMLAGTGAPVDDSHEHAGAVSPDAEIQVSGLAMRDPRRPLAARVAACVSSATRKLRAGQDSGALRSLEQALRLAAPEQSRRVFREAPDELWQLLRRDDDLWARHAWLTDPRTGLEDARPPKPRTRVPGGGATSNEPPRIYEPLTEKEHEVLGHLSELLTTEEIAAVMFISVNTVRTHVRNILRKLAASRRNEAVRRARDLRLIRS